MTLCVVIFNMLKLRRVLECRNVPVQLPQPLMQRRITRPDITNAALEMLYVNRVEANNSSVEANVCFGDIGTKIVRSSVFSKVSFGAVEGSEKRFDGIFVGFLRSRGGKSVAESLAIAEHGEPAKGSKYVAKPDL